MAHKHINIKVKDQCYSGNTRTDTDRNTRLYNVQKTMTVIRIKYQKHSAKCNHNFEQSQSNSNGAGKSTLSRPSLSLRYSKDWSRLSFN